MDKMDAITVIFVLSNDLKDERRANEIMFQAFKACKQKKVNTIWVKERDIYKKELKKTDFIVFETFEGKDFESIKEKKSASIVGPWCVLICLMEGKKIPNFSYPIYNVAMYNCIVTSSNLPKSVELDISEKVRIMGGYYCDGISDNTTHLIADSVKSAKYMRAIEMNIKVLTPSWIDSVWEASQEANIHCNDSQFDKFKCQPLHKLNICITGFSILEEREAVRNMVTENGAMFKGRLNLKTTDFLICEGSAGKMTEKYKAARKTENITCVTLQWLQDSITKGYCLAPTHYSVKKSTSTPQKNDFGSPSSSSSTLTNRAKRKVFTECDNLIEQIDIEEVKRSGQFLDGCSVYLLGFKKDHREKLCKLINAIGATRCYVMSNRVTHVIVYSLCLESHELELIMELIKSNSYCCAIVTLQGLLETIKTIENYGGESYLVNNLRDESMFKSPLGKKGLSLLCSSRIITEKDLTLSQKEKETLQDKNERRESQCPQIFRGFTFFVTSSDDQLELADMQEQIEGGRGSITTNINEANFVVLPYFIIADIHYDEAMTINGLWIDDCITKEEVLPVKYYHRPLFVRNRSVLDDCVVTISGYSGNERRYLSSLIPMLGGTSQEQFCRITSVERNVLGSTHLVTAEASGREYASALKWRLPAVDKDWLIACARSETKLPEQEYSVSKNIAEFNMRQSLSCTVQWDFGTDTQGGKWPNNSTNYVEQTAANVSVPDQKNRKRFRTIFTPQQLAGLEKEFRMTKYLDRIRRSQMALNLGLTDQQIKVWFQNRLAEFNIRKPTRNENIMCCMAAGKWILHLNYVAACLDAGKFLNEEEYEFGNPNSIGKIPIELDRDIEVRMQAIHYWKNEIIRTGRGPFKDMRAIIVVAERKQAYVRVIEAGGGMVIDAMPPFDDEVHATHCFMEPMSVPNFSLYEPLAKQGIYCLNNLFLNDFLHRINKDVKDSILPFYRKYFR